MRCHEMPWDMPDRMPEEMPDKMPWDMPDRMPEDMPDRIPEHIPDRMPEGMPDRMPDKMSDRMPQDLPDRMPEDMPDNMPDRMPDRMPEDMTDRMPEDMPDRMPEDSPDRMPEDMPEHMPDRMPEDVSDRMPEDLPVRKCINVMVGITRSKVIVFIIYNVMTQWPILTVLYILVETAHDPRYWIEPPRISRWRWELEYVQQRLHRLEKLCGTASLGQGVSWICKWCTLCAWTEASRTMMNPAGTTGNCTQGLWSSANKSPNSFASRTDEAKKFSDCWCQLPGKEKLNSVVIIFIVYN